MENENKIKLQSLKEKVAAELDGKMECLEEIITRVDYVATIIRMLLFIYIILKTFGTYNSRIIIEFEFWKTSHMYRF